MTTLPSPRPAGLPAPGPRATPIVLRLCPNAMLTLMALTSLQFVVWFGTLAALVFLVSGFVLWARVPARAISDIMRWWPIHVLTAWCLLSTFWSNEPQITLRLGIQLGLTLLFAVAMATRLSAATFIRVAFLAFGAAAVASLLFGRVRADGEGWLGIYGSKNEFAFAMSVVVLLSVALALERRPSRLRLPAVAMAVLGAVLLVRGNSAGALASTVGAIGIGLALVALRLATPSQRLIIAALAVMGGIAAALLAWGYRVELSAAFLAATGKDVTLTGRTDLWAEALREIAGYPFQGQGFQAFWVPGHPVAEAMWQKFGISGKSGFNFHNTWISNAVEIGIFGVGLQIALFATTLVMAIRWVLAVQSAAALFFSIFMVRQVVMSQVEVVAYFNFSAMTILTVAALVYGMRVQAEVMAGAGSVASSPGREPGRRPAIAGARAS